MISTEPLSARREAVSEQQKVILFVEDTYEIRVTYSAALSSAGYKVIAVESAEKAWAVVQEAWPDLILLDLMMPKVTGFDFLRALRLQDIVIPVIVFSAKDGKESMTEGLSLGADDFVSKGASIPELLERIKMRMERLERLGVGKVESAFYLSPESQSVVIRDQESAVLTKAEFSVLDYFYGKQNQLIGLGGVLQGGLGLDDTHKNRDLVRTYIMAIRRKIEKDPSNPVWLVTHGRQGYMLKIE